MDNVNHPSHYNQGKIEVIEYIEDQQLGYHLGNAVKYISRAGKKNPEKIVEDLEKAIWYIRRQIELQNPAPRRPNDMVEPRQLEMVGLHGSLKLSSVEYAELMKGRTYVDTQKV